MKAMKLMLMVFSVGLLFSSCDSTSGNRSYDYATDTENSGITTEDEKEEEQLSYKEKLAAAEVERLLKDQKECMQDLYEQAEKIERWARSGDPWAEAHMNQTWGYIYGKLSILESRTSKVVNACEKNGWYDDANRIRNDYEKFLTGLDMLRAQYGLENPRY